MRCHLLRFTCKVFNLTRFKIHTHTQRDTHMYTKIPHNLGRTRSCFFFIFSLSLCFCICMCLSLFLAYLHHKASVVIVSDLQSANIFKKKKKEERLDCFEVYRFIFFFCSYFYFLNKWCVMQAKLKHTKLFYIHFIFVWLFGCFEVCRHIKSNR